MRRSKPLPLAMMATLLAAVLLSAPAAQVMAQMQTRPPVIYDSGKTKPVAPFFERFVIKQAPPATQPPMGHQQPPPRGAWLPVHSALLTPGPVAARTLPPIQGIPRKAGLQPVFLVGADDLSYEWLSLNRNRLAALNAVGMVVEADDDKQLALIYELSGQRPIFAASGDDIARTLGLKHYPVLIREDRIEQ